MTSDTPHPTAGDAKSCCAALYAGDWARVLRCGGRVGVSDLTRCGLLPPELDGLLAWVACIADARPVAEYVAYLEEAGLAVDGVEPHDEALAAMVQDIRTRLLGAEVLVKLKKLDLPGADFEAARTLARGAAEAVARGQLGYALITCTARAVLRSGAAGLARPVQ